MTKSDPDHQYQPMVPAHGFVVRTPFTADHPNTNEYIEFEEWWQEYVKTLNMRASLVWQELAWAGWFARSEVCEGKPPSVFPRKEGE